jgi:hypothetical protein
LKDYVGPQKVGMIVLGILFSGLYRGRLDCYPAIQTIDNDRENLHSIMIVLLRQLIPREAKTTPILYGDSCFSKINPKSSLSFTKSCFFTKFQQPKLWISRSVIIQLVSINLQFIFLQYLVILYWNDQQNKKDVFRLIINNVRSINPLLGLRVKLLMIL